MIIHSQTTIYIEQQRVLDAAIEAAVSQIDICTHNRQVYAALVKDFFQQKDGLFSFTLRMNDGNLVDYIKMDAIAPEELLDESQSAQTNY